MKQFNRRGNDIAHNIYNRHKPRHGGWYMTNNLYMARKAKGMTQESLAKKLNINRATISRIERSKHEPLLSLGIAIAEAVGEPVEKIFQVKPFPAAPWRKDPWEATERDKNRWRRMLSYQQI